MDISSAFTAIENFTRYAKVKLSQGDEGIAGISCVSSSVLLARQNSQRVFETSGNSMNYHAGVRIQTSCYIFCSKTDAPLAVFNTP